MIDKMMVSVCMITYGHESYILKALNSILEQVCNFNYEIILSNDRSPDATDDLVNRFIEDHNLFEKIKYFSQKDNLGITPNFLFTVKQSAGKCIAILDGDDYWTDPLKLQKQVDFLEQHQNFSGIATNSLVKYDGLDKEHLFKTNIKSIIETNDLLEARHFHTATFMFKKEVFKDDFPKSVLSADRTLFLLVSCFGPIKLLEDVTAVYRKNEGGISKKVTSRQMKMDYKITSYIRKYNNNFNYFKLNVFISKTVLDYSLKIYFLDFIKASIYLVFYKFRAVKGGSHKLKSINQSLRLIKRNRGKIVL